MFVDNYVSLASNDRQEPGRGEGLMIDHFRQPRNRMHVENFSNFRRPFLMPGHRGGPEHPCVLWNSGRFTTTEQGEKIPISRPYRIADLLNNGIQVPLWTWNATTLRPEDWKFVDDRVVMAVHKPLVAWDDLASRNKISGFNAYAHAVYQYEAMSDAHEAVKDMDLLTPARNDQPLILNRQLPLPITHSDFWYSDRQLEISGNNGQPLSTFSIDMAGRKVGEMVEDTLLGEVTGMTYGTSPSGNYLSPEGTATEYGYQNFTYRNVKTNLTTPTGANPQVTVNEVLDMIQTLMEEDYFGPYVLYYSLAFSEFMNNAYAYTNGSNWAVAPDKTLKQALEDIDQIEEVKLLPRLGGAGEFILILVDMANNPPEAIDGQPVTTLQWETVGGLKKNFKVWCIQVALFRAEYNQNAGILVATTS